jgi:hypothetical protein
MLEARKALEDYETLKGVASSSVHTILINTFNEVAGSRRPRVRLRGSKRGEWPSNEAA